MSSREADARRRTLGGVRRLIADRMMASLRDSAQLTYCGAIQVEDLMAHREALPREARFSLEDAILWAYARTLAAFPDLNATVSGYEVTTCADVDIAIAIAAPGGLVTPVVRAAERCSLAEIGSRRRALVDRATRGELTVAEMRGGSATLSNLGHYPVQYFTPILNSPQVVLLGIGRLERRAVPGADGVRFARFLPVSLTVDHRVADGSLAGQFLERLSLTLVSAPS